MNLSWLGESIEVVLLLVLGLLLWRWALYVRRRAEETAPVPRIAAEFAVLPGELSRHLAADRDVHLAGLDSGSPRNGIVRCWMSFEESATRAGVPPRGSETSTEFVSRLLRSLDLDPRPAARLAELYRVARFSSHRLTTEDRESARQALLALHHELGSAGTLPAEGEVLR
ncbi:MAG TPA: DUF4129 domain-containing protein [Marmoricola sp.]